VLDDDKVEVFAGEITLSRNHSYDILVIRHYINFYKI
jgi:hypothetical protein